MASEPYSKSVLSALSLLPKGKPTFEIDPKKSRNAAAAMTAVLYNRLATVGQVPRFAGRTTYQWGDGIINIRNAVKPFLWTNLRVEWAKAFHASAANRPALYLMACWQPAHDTMHVWAIPEPVMFDALPKLPVREIKEKRTVQIKTNVHRFEQCERSPDLKAYYQSLNLTQPELDSLKEANETDRSVKDRRKEDAGIGSWTTEEVNEKSLLGPMPASVPASRNVISDARYWAIGLGQGGRLWNECQERGIIAIGWNYLGDLSKFPSRDAISQAISASRGPNEPNPIMASKACHQFVHEMAQGDYVIAKIGMNKILGIGIV